MENKYKYFIGVCVAAIVLSIVGFLTDIIGFSNTGYLILLASAGITFAIEDSKLEERQKEAARPWAEKMAKKTVGGIY
jgi:hypothetical protein